MTHATAYRVEHRADGSGPYAVHHFDDVHALDNINGDMCWRANTKHPAPYCDGLENFSQLRFGFDTREAFRAWFGPGAREYLQDRMFVLAVYCVPTCAMRRSTSGKQIVFDRDVACLAWREELTDGRMVP